MHSKIYQTRPYADDLDYGELSRSDVSSSGGVAFSAPSAIAIAATATTDTIDDC